MSDENEEKNLPASEHKLRKAREKGQIASSQDFVGAISTSIGITYLAFAWPGITVSVDEIFSASLVLSGHPSDAQIVVMVLSTFYKILIITAPILGAVLFAGVLANIIHKKGIPFSLDPIKPDFNKINPSKMFSKVFSRRNASEFGVSALRIIVWFTAVGLVMWKWLPDVLRSMTCKGSCTLDVAAEIAILIIIIMIVMLLIIGLLDLPLQNSLFRFEQKMGQQEFKREMKDTQGSPEARQHNRSRHREMLTEAENRRLPRSIVVTSGSMGFALYYDQKEAPVPKVVGVFKKSQVAVAVAEANREKVPVVADYDLPREIVDKVPPGSVIPEKLYGKIAVMLVRAGII